MSTNIWDQLSDTYDTLWVQKYSLTPSRTKLLGLIEGAGEDFSLLDVGCATGQLLCEVKEKYPQAQLFGIDKSPNMIAIAEQKNPDIAFCCVSAQAFHTDTQFDFITCCHSFPYYEDKEQVLKTLSELLKEDGKMIFVQASINNGYDKFVMSIVEQTAEKADYLSRRDFCAMAQQYFVIHDRFTIKEKWFMPSICGFVLGKKL